MPCTHKGSDCCWRLAGRQDWLGEVATLSHLQLLLFPLSQAGAEPPFDLGHTLGWACGDPHHSQPDDVLWMGPREEKATIRCARRRASDGCVLLVVWDGCDLDAHPTGV